VLREVFLEPLGITPYALAAALHVPRARIERLMVSGTGRLLGIDVRGEARSGAARVVYTRRATRMICWACRTSHSVIPRSQIFA
jgi:hypothetical protein